MLGQLEHVQKQRQRVLRAGERGLVPTGLMLLSPTFLDLPPTYGKPFTVFVGGIPFQGSFQLRVLWDRLGNVS